MPARWARRITEQDEMRELVSVETFDLLPPALDWAVAIAEGKHSPFLKELPEYSGKLMVCERLSDGSGWGFSPSTNWSQGGPLTEKYRMLFLRSGKDGYSAYLDGHRPAFYRDGETLLIAACRAIVAAKLGNIVQVPAELCESKPNEA